MSRRSLALLPLACLLFVIGAVPADAREPGASARGVTAPRACGVPDARGRVTPCPNAHRPLPGAGRLIDTFMNTKMAEDRVPGAAVTVVRGGAQILNKGYGLANVQRKLPVDPDRSRFLVGSQEKLFTAQAALQLVRAGKLDLDTDVNTYLRGHGFQIADTYPGRPVTLRNLLTYTAGFDEDHMLGWLNHRESLAKGLAKYQPARVRPPGSGVVYDNYAIALAGYLVELASGMPYATYIKRHVFRPLGMNDSDARCGGQGATRAYLGDGTPTTATCAYETPSGTGPTATPADIGRYMRAQLTRDPRLGRGIAAEMQTQQHSEHPALLGTGYIFEHILHNGHRLLFKGGEMPGMNSYMVVIPELDLGLNVVANGDGAGGDGIDGIELAGKIVDRYLPALTPPASHTAAGLTSAKYEGWYQAGRTSKNSLYRIKAFLRDPVHVAANDDGSIRTTGLSGAVGEPTKPKQWDQIKPGVFQERGGWALIAFPEPGQLAISGSTNVFDQIGVAQLPQVHRVLLGFAAVVSVLALLGFPLLAALRRRATHPRAARAARFLGWLTSAAVVVFIAGFGFIMSDESIATVAILQETVPMVALLVLASAVLPLSGLLVAGLVGAWWKRWWGLPGRVCYTLVTLAAVSFTLFAISYNLVGPPYT